MRQLSASCCTEPSSGDSSGATGACGAAWDLGQRARDSHRVRRDWPFVGRAEEVALIMGALASGAADGAVVAGPPGAGKTRVARAEATGARRREDALRVATWRLDGGGPAPPQLMLAAGHQARARSDLPLAEALGASAGREGEGSP